MADLDLHLSPFSYVGNNPLLYVDPTGMKRVKVDGEEDTYEETAYLPELMVTARRLSRTYRYYHSNLSTMDLGIAALNRHGVDNPTLQAFRDGGRDAALMISAPFVAAAAMEAGAALIATRIAPIVARSSTHIASIGRWTARWASKNLNVGSATGDIATQLATNNGDYSKINWASVLGQLTIKGKYGFVTNSLSAFVKADIDKGPRLEFGRNNLIEFGTNLWANGTTQLLGNLWSSEGAKHLYDTIGNLITGGMSHGVNNDLKNEEVRK